MRDFVFRFLLPISFTGGAFFLILLLLRPLLVRLGARIQKAMLMVAAVLFLLPLPLLFAQGGPFTTAAATAGGTTAQQETLQDTLRTAAPTAPVYKAGEALSSALEEPAPAAPKQTNPALPNSEPSGFSFTAANLFTWASLLYFAGLVVLTSLFFARYFLFQNHIRKTRTPVEDETLLSLYNAACEEYKLKKTPRLYCSEDAGVPFLTGLVRPAILLPAGGMDTKQMDFALRHELMHYKNRDLPLKFILYAVCALHWLNPLVWLLKRQWNETCEQLCDERVAKRFDDDRRKAYAATLFHFAAATAPFAAAGFSSPASALKKRLAKLLQPAHPSRILCVTGAVVLCLSISISLLAGCGLSAGAASPESNDLSGISGSGSLSGSSISATSNTDNQSDISFTVALPASESVSSTATAPSISSAEETGGYLWPVPAYTHCSRGLDSGHRGLDINAPEGTPIYAAQGGTVETAGWHYSYGYYVVIEHADGYKTLYAHCSTLAVAEGQTVAQGEEIAAVGSTGNSTESHCHLEFLTPEGNLLNPLDYITAPRGEDGNG